MHGVFFHTRACNLSISLAFSLALFPLSTWSTKHSFATTPSFSISWTTCGVAENLETQRRILTALSFANVETLKIFFETMARPAPWLNSSALPSAHWHSISNSTSIISQGFLSLQSRRSSIKTGTVPASTALILFLPQGENWIKVWMISFDVFVEIWSFKTCTSSTKSSCLRCNSFTGSATSDIDFNKKTA